MSLLPKRQPIPILHDSFDGENMRDTGPRHNETPMPGCQQALKEREQTSRSLTVSLLQWHAPIPYIMSLLPNGMTHFDSIFLSGFLMARAWETQGQDTMKLPGQAASRCWRRMHAMNSRCWKKDDDKHAYDRFFHFYLRVITNLEKDLKNDDKTCDVFSSYYVSTTTTQETQWYAFPASQQQTCDNNTNTLDHIQLAPCQTSMRSGKTSDMLFLNDLDPYQKTSLTSSSKDFLLRSALSNFPAKSPQRHNKNPLHTWRNWKNTIQITRCFHGELNGQETTSLSPSQGFSTPKHQNLNITSNPYPCLDIARQKKGSATTTSTTFPFEISI